MCGRYGLGAFPNPNAVCVYKTDTLLFSKQDVLTTDQSVFQENQNPALDVTAALFPAQPEGFPFERGWDGEGWSSDSYDKEDDHAIETELAQGFEVRPFQRPFPRTFTESPDRTTRLLPIVREYCTALQDCFTEAGECCPYIAMYSSFPKGRLSLFPVYVTHITTD